jgi:hypothetical protein
MSYSLSFFQKELHQLGIGDLIEYFNEEQEETSTLEFKSGDVGLEKLHGEVCAFLNTEGGLLIIGAPKETEGNKRGVCIGKLTSCTYIKSEHSLMQSLASNISPTPTGIKCKALQYDTGYVYVLEVPQSMHPPHQVSREGKYYIRLDKEAKAAPHGIVEALFFRRVPEYELVGSFHKSSLKILTDMSGGQVTMYRVITNLTIENTGRRPISLVKATFGLTVDQAFNPEYILYITTEFTANPLILKAGEIKSTEVNYYIPAGSGYYSSKAEHADTLKRYPSHVLVTDGQATTTNGKSIELKMEMGI